jgi:hypothetical protein
MTTTPTSPDANRVTLGSWVSYEGDTCPYQEGLIVDLDPLTVVWENYDRAYVDQRIAGKRFRVLDHPPADRAMCRRWSDCSYEKQDARLRQTEAGDRERGQREADWRRWLNDNRPPDARAIIVAEYIEDQSDATTDYHGSTLKLRVFLGWSKSSRFSFVECRRAAKKFVPTMHLATANKDFEHRERYSMGGGMYLKDGYRHETGWRVRKEWVSESCTPKACCKVTERDILQWAGSEAAARAQVAEPVVDTEALEDDRPLAKVIPFPRRGE